MKIILAQRGLAAAAVIGIVLSLASCKSNAEDKPVMGHTQAPVESSTGP